MNRLHFAKCFASHTEVKKMLNRVLGVWFLTPPPHPQKTMWADSLNFLKFFQEGMCLSVFIFAGFRD